MAQDSTPNHSFIHFLNTYRPGSDKNVSLFDERSATAAKKARIVPFQLPTPELEEICRQLRSDEPVNVLVTGVAGDGKTYLCRKVWTDLNGGLEDGWSVGNHVRLMFETDGGRHREVLFVKDLTDADYDKDCDHPDNVLNLLVNRLDDPDFSIVIACNHGQILKQLGNGTPAMKDLARCLEDSFFGMDGKLPKGLSFFDLTHSRQDDLFRKVVSTVCGHEAWAVCEGCEIRKARQCPICANKDAFLKEDGSLSLMTERVAQLFRLLELEGTHFPIREQLSFVSNAILGKRLPRRGPGSTVTECRHIRASLSTGRFDYDVFNNLFGYNLPARVRKAHRIYSAFAKFGIGVNSNSFFDGVLLDGIPKKHLVSGATSSVPTSLEFRKARDAYIKEANGVAGSSISEIFQDEIQKARRRLFLSWEPASQLDPDNVHELDCNIWALTAFPHAGEYLRKVAFDSAEDLDRSRKLTDKLFAGLYQVMTGNPQRGSKQLLTITTQGADVNPKYGVYVVADYFVNNGKAKIRIEPFSKTREHTPTLVCTLTNGVQVRFKLTPRRYECLMQLGAGYLSSSFSKECLSELMSFKASLIQAWREAVGEPDKYDDEVSFKLLPDLDITIKTNLRG